MQPQPDESRFVEEPPRPDDSRNPFRIDRDRILYSAAFARLAEITQVVSPERGYVFHNRLTHSLKVAQIARTLAERFLKDFPADIVALGGLDPDAAETAGLAHDLGHPPFGHIAEKELDRLTKAAGLTDGFEGNAQSFRILCTTAIGDAFAEKDNEVVSVSGLNLTKTTLAGVLKYPWAHLGNPDKKSTWGYYNSEASFFEWAHPPADGFKRSLTAEIMDWSDDVTYAIHDLLDFYRAGMIPLELVKGIRGTSLERGEFLSRVFTRRPEWAPERTLYESALDAVLAWFPFQPTHRYVGTDRDEQELYRFATRLITRFVDAITPSSASVVDIDPDVRRQVEILKEFVWPYVILNPDLAVVQIGQRRAIEEVFSHALRAARHGHPEFFSGSFGNRLSRCETEESKIRHAVDYVAGMTERELMHTYRRLIGVAN